MRLLLVIRLRLTSAPRPTLASTTEKTKIIIRTNIEVDLLDIRVIGGIRDRIIASRASREKRRCFRLLMKEEKVKTKTVNVIVSIYKRPIFGTYRAETWLLLASFVIGGIVKQYILVLSQLHFFCQPPFKGLLMGVVGQHSEKLVLQLLL